MMPTIRDRRLGRFHVSPGFIVTAAMRLVMSCVVVVKCTYDPVNDTFEYVGFGPRFDLLEFGRTVPEYKFVFYHDHISGIGIHTVEKI